MSGSLAELGGWMLSLMHALGYRGLALVLFLQNILSPLPSELVLPLAGALVSGGGFAISVLILAATAGSLAYSLALWAVVRLFGEERVYRLVKRHGKWLLIRTSDVEKARRFFADHGGKAVFLARFFTGVRSVMPIPASIAGMPLLPFSLYTVLGSGIANAALILLGALLRQNWREISGYLETLGYAGYAILAALVLWFVVARLSARGAAEDPDEKP